MIISFGWTTAALLSGNKTVTRRQWREGYGSSLKAGSLIEAWSRSPRYGGKRIALIRLTHDPYREPAEMIPDSDYEAEGFAFLSAIRDKLTGQAALLPLDREAFDEWRQSGTIYTVLRFEVVAYLMALRVP